jgi:hypothetical protein
LKFKSELSIDLKFVLARPSSKIENGPNYSDGTRASEINSPTSFHREPRLRLGRNALTQRAPPFPPRLHPFLPSPHRSIPTHWSIDRAGVRSTFRLEEEGVPCGLITVLLGFFGPARWRRRPWPTTGWGGGGDSIPVPFDFVGGFHTGRDAGPL